MVQIRDLYDSSTLTDASARSPPFVIWTIAVLLYVVGSYPYQPVIFPWLGPWPQVTYVLLCFLCIAILLTTKSAGITVQYSALTIAAVAFLTSTMLVTLALYKNPTVVRDLLLLAIIVVFVFKTRGTATLQIIRALTYVCVAALVPAIIVVTMFNAGLIDWPSWSVDRLGLAAGNPLINRQNWADAEYYLPYRLALVPHVSLADQGFGLHFTRQPFVYIEPTDTWYYTAGLFWFAIADTKMVGRRFCLAIMAIALLGSFSVAGVLATILAVAMCGAMAVGGRKFLLLLVCAGALLIASVPFDRLLAALGSNKADQFHYYKMNVTVFTHLTLFGNAASTDDQPKSYGSLVVVYRYGVIGAAIVLTVIVAMTAVCFGLLKDKATLGWRRFPLFIGCFISLAILSKYPGIVPAIPAVCLAGGLSLRQTRMDPFTLSLLH